MTTWRVFTLDVWGNEDDGFEVNDRRHLASVSTLEDCDHPSNPRVWEMLVGAGLVEPKEYYSVTFDGNDGLIFIDDEVTGKPILQLEREE